MTQFVYSAYNRRVFSDRPLALLNFPIAFEPPSADDIQLVWSDDPVDIEGPAVCGHPLTAIHGIRGENGLWAILPGTGSVAWVPDDGLAVTIHPHANQTGELNPDGRRDTDSLVTGLLSRIPDRWGALPLHTAALLTPSGVVLITGRSGAGKSTISQTLQREYGWTILDDDSCAAEILDGEVTVTALGGVPRMRGDAAHAMKLQGDAIPGYEGNKISVPGRPADAIPGAQQPQAGHRVVGTFYLSRSEEGVGDDGDSSATITPIFGGEAFSAVLSAGVGLNRFARSWKEKRFQIVSRLCQRPVFSVTYVPGRAAPSDVAKLIHNNFSQMSRAR